MKIDRDQVYKCAVELREAFEAFRDACDSTAFLKQFPHESCTVATIASAIYLHEYCGLNKDQVSSRWNGKTKEGEGPHAWLVVGGDLCVDITADQFDISERVLVQPSDQWHFRFQGYSSHDYDDTVVTSAGWKESNVFPVFCKLPNPPREDRRPCHYLFSAY